MEIVLINQTKVSTNKIKEIIRFVRPKNTTLPKIKIRSVTSFCFYGAYYYGNGTDERIYTSVGPYDKFPNFITRSRISQKEGYLSDFWLNSKEEALVYLLAHETRHCFQDQNPNAPRIGYKNRHQKFSETDADTYALQKLKSWRKRKKNI